MAVSGLASGSGRFTLGKKAPRIHWTGGWVGPTSDLDALDKSSAEHKVEGDSESWVGNDWDEEVVNDVKVLFRYLPIKTIRLAGNLTEIQSRYSPLPIPLQKLLTVNRQRQSA
jgi:hypothetical protein